MNLDAADVLRLLPRFMRNDRTAAALCAAIKPTLDKLTGAIRAMHLFQVDGLPERMLDELAKQRNVLWYDYSADVGVKKALIESAYNVHRAIGTRSAIERVVADYFGDATVQEWWEYGGEPFHFRIYTSNSAAVAENGAKLKRIVELVKRASAVMDGIYVETSGTVQLYTAIAVQTYQVLQFRME
ncbi:phage tail protein I [Bacillota bacterium Meth-B3]